MNALSAYIPQDRRYALARGETLPDCTRGSALFADISGFTPLTEQLTRELGTRRGAEELTRHINVVYDALIAEVERQGGSVISFAGDAITCWFANSAWQIANGRVAWRMADGEQPQPLSAIGYPLSANRAVLCALAMQAAMCAFPELTLKVAVTTGAARRFVVGDPNIQLLDALAGATVARLAVAEHLAQRGEVIADEPTVEACREALSLNEWRVDAETQQRFAVIASSSATFELSSITTATTELPDEVVRAWVLPAVYEREQSGHGAFLTELRPAIALFVRFAGIDYDGDEVAGAKLDTFMRRAQTIITRYGSVLSQFVIGDKGSYLLAIFGAPIAHEDDARRAIHAALALCELPRELPFVQAVHSGLSQGIMRAGTYGSTTRCVYSVQGDEVNLSARLMSMAMVGEILVSGRVQQLTGQVFTFEPRPPLPLKGKAESLPVFAVTSERKQRAIRLQEPTYTLPMVGRQSELQIINDKLDLSLQGKSQVIGIIAEAGMGKSRLVAEVIRAARKKGFAGYGGVCQSDAINTPYQAWKAIGAAFFDVDPSAPLRKQIRSLENEIEDRTPERLRAMPLLGALLNLDIPDNDFTKPLEPQYRQSALRALLEDCLRATAKDEPLLIVIEDLHWIDALSHDLLEELARALTDCPICFVLTYRPPQLQRLPAPRLEALPNFTKIPLSELNASEAAQAIRAKLAQLYLHAAAQCRPSSWKN
jgi:class 3 adenylate cyclase